MFQTVHGVSQRKKIRENRQRVRHHRNRKEDPAKKDHGKAKEIGHGHGLKDLFDAYRDQDSQKGEGKAGKDEDENKRPEVFYRKPHEWNQDESDENSNDQPKESASKGLA